MDVRLAQLRFQQKLQNHLDYEVDIRTIDIEYFLTKGQELYIDNTYEKYKGQESLRKRLSGVYKDDILDSATYKTDEIPFRGGEVWQLPEGARYIMDEYVIEDGGNELISVKPVDAAYYNKQSKNPYKKPYGKLVWRMDRGDTIINNEKVLLHELIPINGVTIGNYGIVYIKTPEDVELTQNVVQFEVSEEYHSEIIDLAVGFALDIYRVSGRLIEPNKE